MHHKKEDLERLGITPAETKHNQHRRAAWADYAGTGLYMVTLCIEGRQPVFGHLEGDIRAQRGTDAFPHLGSPSADALRPAPAAPSSSSPPGASPTICLPTTSASTASMTSPPKSATPPTSPSSASTTSPPARSIKITPLRGDMS